MSVKSKLEGRRFGRLVVLGDTGKRRWKEIRWLCKCDCGKLKITGTQSLKKGDTKSCGCYRGKVTKERFTTHGLCKHPLYSIWCDMSIEAR